MIFMNIKTGEYPRHQGDLELLGWKNGEPLPENWVEVEYVHHPNITDRQKFTQLPPIEENGKWKMRWIVEDMTEEEYQNNLIEQENHKRYIEELLNRKTTGE